MTIAIVVSVVVPILTGAVLLAVRNRLPRLAADVRGIALQTVIIMVVLLAIAGAVAGVLLTRGGEAVTDIEQQDISRDPGDFDGEALCKAAGYSWSNDQGPCIAN